MPAKAADVLALIEKIAPELAAKIGPMIAKDMTVGDVHVATALGNQGGKKLSFAEKLADIKAGKIVKPPKTEATEGEAYGKSIEPWAIPLDIVKSQPEQQLIFGWASIAEKDGKLIIDKQGDIIMPDDLEKAAYDFVLYSRQGGDMHSQKGVSRCVESMVFTKQKQDILGIDLGLVGWWTGWRVDKPELWQAMKRGERPEFSIGGRGNRVEV